MSYTTSGILLSYGLCPQCAKPANPSVGNEKIKYCSKKCMRQGSLNIARLEAGVSGDTVITNTVKDYFVVGVSRTCTVCEKDVEKCDCSWTVIVTGNIVKVYISEERKAEMIQLAPFCYRCKQGSPIFSDRQQFHGKKYICFSECQACHDLGMTQEISTNVITFI